MSRSSSFLSLSCRQSGRTRACGGCCLKHQISTHSRKREREHGCERSWCSRLCNKGKGSRHAHTFFFLPFFFFTFGLFGEPPSSSSASLSALSPSFAIFLASLAAFFAAFFASLAAFFAAFFLAFSAFFRAFRSAFVSFNSSSSSSLSSSSSSAPSMATTSSPCFCFFFFFFFLGLLSSSTALTASPGCESLLHDCAKSMCSPTCSTCSAASSAIRCASETWRAPEGGPLILCKPPSASRSNVSISSRSSSPCASRFVLSSCCIFWRAFLIAASASSSA
mmetsp:Transcript_33489/g.88171  ORF Transcript_33489/g.88171 Transcript_33489/m.88171 type:complete len:279 (-) Transcript_33489:132-968(-)